MFKYRCAVCGVSAYSSASYSAVGACPSCGSPLAKDAIETVPEPDPVSMRERLAAARSARRPERHPEEAR